MQQVTIIEKFYTPNLNVLCKELINSNPSNDEITLLSVLAIMDETLREFAEKEGVYKFGALQTYNEIEQYLKGEGHS